MPVAIQRRRNQFRDIHNRIAVGLGEAAAAERMQGAVTKAAQIYYLAAVQEAPVGKPDPLGRQRRWPPLAKNINYMMTRQRNRWRVQYRAPPQVEFVIHGTRPHAIVGSRWPLHFYWDRVGAEVWFWRVQHPGTQPNPFHLRALKRAQGEMQAVLNQELKAWIHEKMTG